MSRTSARHARASGIRAMLWGAFVILVVGSQTASAQRLLLKRNARIATRRASWQAASTRSFSSALWALTRR